MLEKNRKDLNINYGIVILEPIEVLEGVQQTLIGSGAKAGVPRY